MDKIDKKILDILQSNSRISNQDLADQVALSPSPCLRRVKQLEESGYINKHVAVLNQEQLNLALTIFVAIGLDNHLSETMKHFEKQIKNIDAIIQCHLITGQSADYLLKIVAPDMKTFQDLLIKKITRIKGVNSIQSSFALTSIIDKTTLPLDYIT